MGKFVLGEELAYLADLTSIQHLYNYVTHDPRIDLMIGVNDSELKLEDVAAAFVNGDVDLVAEWMYANMLTHEVPQDMGLAAKCICVEPFYVYKLTGGRYE